MSKEAQQLLAAALSLPEADRAALVVDLLSSIRADADVEAAHVSETKERLTAHQRGDLEEVSQEAALRLISE